MLLRSELRNSNSRESEVQCSLRVFVSVVPMIFCDNLKFSSTDAFKGLIMIPKSKKVFSNHQTWHVAHVAQLAAAAGSPHSRHTQP